MEFYIVRKIILILVNIWIVGKNLLYFKYLEIKNIIFDDKCKKMFVGNMLIIIYKL